MNSVSSMIVCLVVSVAVFASQPNPAGSGWPYHEVVEHTGIVNFLPAQRSRSVITEHHLSGFAIPINPCGNLIGIVSNMKWMG